jgi:Coenzyme PQQ synthesis protein D (PqqD)
MENHSSHLRTIRNSDGAVVLDLAQGKITTLNSTGAFVWDALQSGDELSTIAANLARETGMQMDALESDLREFTGALRARQLLGTDRVI